MLAALNLPGLNRAASSALPTAAHLLHLCSSFSSSSSSSSSGGDAGSGQAPPQPLGAVPQPSVVSINDDGPASQHTTAAQQRPPKVLSVGGSIAGCCLALALGRVGCEVEVFERSTTQLESQGAGLVLQPDLRDFVTYFGIMLEDVCVTSNGRQYIDRDAQTIGYDDSPQLFTGWDTLYRALKSKVPPKHYHLGSTVESIRVSEGGVALTLAGGQQHSGDLLIGADGGGSMVRSLFWPEVQGTYAGYVCWRGFVSESECPQALTDFIGNRFTLFQGPNYHILAYVIPGQQGEMEPGKRRINWVWYWTVDWDLLQDYLVDIHGFKHGHSVKKGLLRPEIAQERRDLARELLPAPMADLVCCTQDIFMQAIHDLLAPSLVHDNGRVVLVGDSGCVLRPHTAAGTTKAAVNAWTLSKSLQLHNFDLPTALAEYNLTQTELARYLVDVGVSIGTRSQFSSGPKDRVAHASCST